MWESLHVAHKLSKTHDHEHMTMGDAPYTHKECGKALSCSTSLRTHKYGETLSLIIGQVFKYHQTF